MILVSSFQRCMTKNESPPPIIWRKGMHIYIYIYIGDGRARDKGCTSTTNYSTNQEFSSDKEEPVVIRLLRRIDAYKEQSSPNRKGKGNSPVSNLLEKEEKFTQEAKFNSSEKYPLPKENYKRRFSPQVGYRSSAIVDKHDFHSEQYTQREKRQGCTSQESRLCPRTSFTRKCKQLSARGIMEFPNSPSTFVIGKNDLTPLKDYLDRLKVIRKKYSDILLKLSLEEGMDIKHIVAKKKDFHTSPKSFKFTSKAGIAQQIINDAFREAYSKEEVLKVVQEVEENYKITRTLLLEQKLMEEKDALDVYKQMFSLKTSEIELKEEEEEDKYFDG